ncbi:MAG: 23S rRNA (guanosine(2251)-2'-O)-methyltransferase RlmB [Gammaproteobacteria bacterium]|nr:23S rRNA (guanosine(2251)-2'-O)-methyltransferase RlmB [Gammaproteobacteria bacterium]
MPADEHYLYGLHAVLSALRRNAGSIQTIWAEQRRRDQRLRQLLDEAERQQVRVEWAERDTLDRLSQGARHQGVVAQYAGSTAPSWDERDLPALLAEVDGPPLLLVLDGVQDPHNLGACLRSADAAGVHAVIAPADRAVGLTPAVRKVACGAAEVVPFIQVTNLARTLRQLQELGLWMIGAAGEAEQSLYQTDLSGPLAIVVGAEEKGLRRLTRETCDGLAHIPMLGSVESLNVSVATGIFLFEALRQRRR